MRRFKVGDLVICADPEKCGLPGDVATVVHADWWRNHRNELEPAITVDYGYTMAKDLRRFEWVFNPWSPTAATDAGFDEYNEIMAMQESVNGS